MSGVAIVAIPSKNDPVWVVSSEKIPHMTLLFLGDALAKEDYRHVQEFVTHVADTTLGRFGMSVDKRGVLGDDEADVLFFKNTDDSKISLFRAYLLQDSKIREAYESIEQFDGWTPHLTLGYPETPAKKDPREVEEFYWVGFDRLMLWTGEFEGPEIELNDEDLAVAMSGVAEATEAFLAHYFSDVEVPDPELGLTQSELDAGGQFLEHYGVKGQQWGVRRSREERRADRTARIKEKSEKKIAKAEEYTARAKAKEAVAKAKTETADAKAAAATAKLESKVAKGQAKLAKTEARTGKDDPSNGLVREPNGIVSDSNRKAKNLREAAAKDARTLDDQTLKAYTERLSTEKKLKEAISEDTAPRRAATKKLLNETGKDLAKKALIGVGSMAIYYVLATKGGKESYRVKSSAEGMGRLLSGAPKTSGKDAFTVQDFKLPPPSSINSRKASPF